MDWHLQQDESGDVFLIAGTTQINLGPRDEALVRIADFFGDEAVPPREMIVPERMR